MKKYILVIFMVVNACGMNNDKKQDLLNLAKSEEDSEKADAIKIATIGVTIYRDRHYNHGAWDQIINAIEKFENDEFSIDGLKKTIDLMYETSCKSAGIWGSAPVTFVKDAEKIDGPKSGPSDKQK